MIIAFYTCEQSVLISGSFLYSLFFYQIFKSCCCNLNSILELNFINFKNKCSAFLFIESSQRLFMVILGNDPATEFSCWNYTTRTSRQRLSDKCPDCSGIFDPKIHQFEA